MTDNPLGPTSSPLQDTMIEILVDLEDRLIETSADYPDIDMEGLSEGRQVFRCPRCREMSLRRISYSSMQGASVAEIRLCREQCGYRKVVVTQASKRSREGHGSE